MSAHDSVPSTSPGPGARRARDKRLPLSGKRFMPLYTQVHIRGNRACHDRARLCANSVFQPATGGSPENGAEWKKKPVPKGDTLYDLIDITVLR